MSDSEEDAAGNLTYATRNPQKEVIPPRGNAQPTQTTSQKQATALRRSQARQAQEAFYEDLEELKDAQEKGVKAVADKHGRKVSYVKHSVTTHKK